MTIRLLLHAVLVHFCVVVSSRKMWSDMDAIGWYARVTLVQNELDKIVEMMEESSACAKDIRTEKAKLIDKLLGYWWQEKMASALGTDSGIDKSQKCIFETEQLVPRFMKGSRPEEESGTTPGEAQPSVTQPNSIEQGSEKNEGNYKCPENWNYFNETKACYKAVHGTYKYKRASKACRKEGSTLASITTPAEKDFVNALFDGTEMYWIGLNKFSGEFKWEDGSAFNYTNWRESEPNGCCGNHPECVIANYRNSDGQWDDGTCGYLTEPPLRHSYICKKTATLEA